MARPTLKKGMRGKRGTELGDAILLWRNFVGLAPASNVMDIDFGPATDTATKKFQKEHGLKQDGEVGPKTWAMYDNLQYGPPPPPVAAQAATTIAQAAPAPAVAVQAAAAIKQTSKPAAPQPVASAAAKAVSSIKQQAKNATSSTAAVTAPSAHLPRNFEELKHQAVKVYDETPLWLRIVGGAVTGLLAWSGLSRLTSKSH
jgi:peptidoglycan hydrolase-like protein with peptidoglycan-binding domain